VRLRGDRPRSRGDDGDLAAATTGGRQPRHRRRRHVEGLAHGDGEALAHFANVGLDAADEGVKGVQVGCGEVGVSEVAGLGDGDAEVLREDVEDLLAVERVVGAGAALVVLDEGAVGYDGVHGGGAVPSAAWPEGSEPGADSGDEARPRLGLVEVGDERAEEGEESNWVALLVADRELDRGDLVAVGDVGVVLGRVEWLHPVRVVGEGRLGPGVVVVVDLHGLEEGVDGRGVGVLGLASHVRVEPLLDLFVVGDEVGVLVVRVGRIGRRFGDVERLRKLHCVVGDEVNEVEVGDELLLGGGVEGVEDDAAALGVALDVDEGLGGASLVGVAASMADVALDLLGSVALLDDRASDLFVLGVGR
jgi:hypothetical protein